MAPSAVVASTETLGGQTTTGGSWSTMDRSGTAHSSVPVAGALAAMKTLVLVATKNDGLEEPVPTATSWSLSAERVSAKALYHQSSAPVLPSEAENRSVPPPTAVITLGREPVVPGRMS